MNTNSNNQAVSDSSEISITGITGPVSKSSVNQLTQTDSSNETRSRSASPGIFDFQIFAYQAG